MIASRTINCTLNRIIILLLVALVQIVNCYNFQSDHTVDLDENYRLLWQIKGDDIIFEIQVRTLGYVGLGFSRDGSLYGADVVIGWVDQGQAFFQDRHFKKHDIGEPVNDPQQNYILSLGYENATHTVLRFSRKLDTCDKYHDVPITNDTMHVIFAYHKDEPQDGLIVPGSLPSPSEAFKNVRPMFLLQRVIDNPIKLDDKVKSLELRNEDADLPDEGDSIYWCKMFKLTEIQKKHHVIKYEPIFESDVSQQYLNNIVLYECQSSSPELEIKSREFGQRCDRGSFATLTCNTVVAAWARGSSGFTFPADTGYEIDSNQARFYLMETHYANLYSNDKPDNPRVATDNSGLRLYYTPVLRKYDVGVLSIGIEPTWRHIIPPGQPRVVSEGHCVEECTRRSFPRDGINIFATMFRTHSIGRQMKLRRIRRRQELSPIVQDRNVIFDYQDYRRLASPIKSLPGDRLITECIYNSTSRPAITLGGQTLREEMCLTYVLYYPRQKELTSCHSSPSLPTVLHSLGIEQLDMTSNPVAIFSPPELKGMTLEQRLISYDWKKYFSIFQAVTTRGSFKAQCLNAKNSPLVDTENLDGYAPNITKAFKQQKTCSFRDASSSSSRIPNTNSRFHVTDTDINIVDGITITELDENNIIEGAARSKVSRSSANSEMLLLGLSGTSPFSSISLSKSYPLVLILCLLFCNSFRISLLQLQQV